jgi:hypothetical protein
LARLFSRSSGWERLIPLRVAAAPSLLSGDFPQAEEHQLSGKASTLAVLILHPSQAMCSATHPTHYAVPHLCISSPPHFSSPSSTQPPPPTVPCFEVPHLVFPHHHTQTTHCLTCSIGAHQGHPGVTVHTNPNYSQVQVPVQVVLWPVGVAKNDLQPPAPAEA